MIALFAVDSGRPAYFVNQFVGSSVRSYFAHALFVCNKGDRLLLC